MVAYEVKVKDEVGQPVRYDTADAGFHRHKIGWPQPSGEREYLAPMDSAKMLAYAKAEILTKYKEWDDWVLRRVYGA